LRFGAVPQPERSTGMPPFRFDEFYPDDKAHVFALLNAFLQSHKAKKVFAEA